MDRLSTFNEELLHKILLMLPMKEAFRVGILSREWRMRPNQLRNLIINEDSFEGTEYAYPYGERWQLRLQLVVYPLITLQTPDLHELSLDLHQLESCLMLDDALRFLAMSRRNLQKITLFMKNVDGYRLTASFYSMQNLTHIELHNCQLRPPVQFNGFLQLTNLKLFNVQMNILELGRFIANSQRLRSIILLGGLVGMEPPDDGGFETLNALIPNLEDLHTSIHNFTHQYALWDMWTYRNLRTLMLRNICFCVDNQFHSLACLLRRTPALRKLVITKLCMELAQDQIANVHLGPYLNAPLLNELLEVEIRNIHCVWRTISLLMFVFEQSPNLQHVTLSLEYVVPVEEQVVLGYFLEANLEVLDRNISFVVRYWPHQ